MFSFARLVTCFLTVCSGAALISPAIMLGGVTEPLPLATAEPDPPNARAMMLVIARTATRILGSFLNDCNPLAYHCPVANLKLLSKTCTSDHRRHIRHCAALFDRWRMSISRDAEEATE